MEWSVKNKITDIKVLRCSKVWSRMSAMRCYVKLNIAATMCSIELYVVFKCPLTEKYDLIELQANWIFISLT